MARREKIVNSGDPLKAVRVQIGEAESKLQTACTILRSAGFPENADALSIEIKRLRVWTGPAGWLSYLEKGEPEGKT